MASSSIFHQVLFLKYPSLSDNSPVRSPLRFRSTIRAASSLALEPGLSTKNSPVSEVELFSCPVCYEPLIRKGPPGFSLPAIYRSGFKCNKCNKAYSSKDIYLDLTVTAGTEEYTESKPQGTELFRWVLVDVSCGSGLFSRKFAKSRMYARIAALDFSENMLRQCYDFIKSDDTILSTNLALVRADVSRLPFSSGSVDTVHAGAALHCWPSPSNAVAEINRILRSGGVFVGTTFLRYTSSTPAIVRSFRGRVLRNYNHLTEGEIEDPCTSCGLVNYSSRVQQAFIMFSAQKP
ncbi:Methyltransferase type 11 [Dillenia turbinata]|uniref:Methyltransferase type 11 n=1 Tax=Dillenia turbinata TaxID=194707 RepID=A0AAN8ZQJ0_9MAGN